MKEGSAKNCGNGEKKSETPLPQRSDCSVVSGVEASLPLSLQKTPSSLDPANTKPTHPSTLLQILKKVCEKACEFHNTHTHRTWRVFSSSNRVRSASCMSILVVRRVRRLDPHSNQSSILFSFPILLSCLLHAQCLFNSQCFCCCCCVSPNNHSWNYHLFSTTHAQELKETKSCKR